MYRQNKETLKLYRDILRACRVFTWKNADGMIWRQVLHENARKEIEMNRFEGNTLIVAKLVFNGRQALNQINEKLLNANNDFKNKIDSTRTDKT